MYMWCYPPNMVLHTPCPALRRQIPLLAAPVPQPPADLKKKNMGLLIGGMLAIGVAMAILLGLMFSGVFGGCPSAPH